jgi:hypothetical protein
MKMENKKQLMAELLHIAEETRDFNPPYIPRRYLQDVAPKRRRRGLARNAPDGHGAERVQHRPQDAGSQARV